MNAAPTPARTRAPRTPPTTRTTGTPTTAQEQLEIAQCILDADGDVDAIQRCLR